MTPSEPDPLVLRNERQATALEVITGIYGALILLAAWDTPAGHPRWGLRIGAVLLVLGSALFVFGRLSRMRVVANEFDLVVVNPLRSTHVEWSRIESFSVDRSGFITRVGFVNTRDGRIPMFATAGPNAAIYHGSQVTEALVETLNNELVRRRRPVADSPPTESSRSLWAG
jgi:hypothetical protein